MKIFISWSGNQSRNIAENIKKFIKNVIQATEPFISTEINKGTQWFNEIANHLANSEFGIICLTKENLSAPWILFESGALFKGMEKTKICTVLFGVNQDDVKDPLAFFNGTRFSEEQVLKLIETINNSLTQPLSPEHLRDSFNKHYNKFRKDVEKIISEGADCGNNEFCIRLQKSQNQIIADMQIKAYSTAMSHYEKYISELNSGKFLIHGGHVEYMEHFLILNEKNASKKPENISIFAYFTSVDVIERQKAVWPNAQLERYKKLVFEGKITLNYVMYFDNEETKISLNYLIEDYKTFTTEIRFIIKNNSAPISETPSYSIVLLRNRQWVYTHKWDKFFGNMKEAYLFTSLPDWNKLLSEYNFFYSISTSK